MGRSYENKQWGGICPEGHNLLAKPLTDKKACVENSLRLALQNECHQKRKEEQLGGWGRLV